MRYSTFEVLAAGFGTAAVVGTVVAGVLGGSGYPEIIAQFMMLPILIAALHFGRNGGFLSALFATALYVGLRVPDISVGGMGSAVVALVGVRAFAYLVMGVIGGEVCSRIKYFFLRLEQHDLIDGETGIYSSKQVGRILGRLIQESRRYGTVFSATVVTLDGAVVPMGGVGGREANRPLLKDMAGTLRGEVRAVDEVGRQSEGSFLALFPNTPLEGGRIAAGRLDRSVRSLLDRRGILAENAFTIQTLGYPEDPDELVRLAEQLTGETLAVEGGPVPAPQRA
jgi:GGDEF domain-containing protein